MLTTAASAAAAAADRRHEDLARQCVEVERRARANLGGPGDVAQEGNLPERVTASQGADAPAVAEHVSLSGGDHIELW
jgi:hypothetical protein